MNLNKTIRQWFVDQLTEKAFKHRQKDKEQAKADFALKCHHTLYPTHLHQLAQQLPQEAQASANYYTIYDSVYGKHYYFHLKKSQPVIYGTHRCVLEKGTPLYKEAIELIRQIEKLEEEIEQFQADVWGALNSCTTIKKLREIWPNLNSLIDEAVRVHAKVSTPANALSIINRLDQMIPLP